MSKERENVLWSDKKRTIFGLPLSFTKYELTEDRLFISKGLLKTTYDEVRLYRMLDVQLNRTLGQKLFGLGTISVHSSDASMKDFNIVNIKKSNDVLELLSQNIEKQRDAHRVFARELVDDGDDDNY